MEQVPKGERMDGVRALIVDDHGFTRVLMNTYLDSLNHVVVGHTGTAREAIEIAAHTKPNLAILDLDLGVGPTGIDLAHGLRKLLPSIGLVMLTSYEDPRLLRVKNLELPLGTVYIGKQEVTSGQMLTDAIELAMANTFSDFSGKNQESISRVYKLSDSQIEIMRLVAAGLSNARIAELQYITEAAVGKAVARLIRQLDIVASKNQNQRVLIAQAYYTAIGPVTARRE